MATETKEITKRELSPIATVRDLLEKSKKQIQMALPGHMNADRMLRVAMTSVQKNPVLLDCHPITLVGAIIQAAQLGLEPDNGTGEAYLIPFRNNKKDRLEVQFMAGYRGLLKLARRSNEIRSVEARVVHEKDFFDYSFGLNPKLEHKPSQDADAGKVVYFYAVAHFNAGGAQFDVMTKADVDKIRQSSKAGGSGPWATHYEEMGKKTVLRRLCKLLPFAVELQQAVTLDEKAEVGVPQDLGTLVDPEEKGTVQDAPAAEIPMPGRKSQTKQEELPNG